MAQPDLDAPIDHRKISRIILADWGDEEDHSSEDDVIHCDIVAPDDPPDSFWLSKNAEYDWLDRNAFYERKDSTRGNSTNLNKSTNSNHNSQRFSGNLKSKASIIGLPKTQKAAFTDSSCRRPCKSTNIRLFPKQSATAGKSTVAVIEPGSPKVSCTGRVRSRRGRRRSNSSKRSDEAPPAKESEKSAAKKDKKKKENRFYSKIMSIFRPKKKPPRYGSRKVEAEKPAAAEQLRKSESVKSVPEPPGLGGLKRFASGRQSAEDFSQVYPEPL